VLAVNQTATIDVPLHPAQRRKWYSGSDRRTIAGFLAELGTVIATKQVNDLPLNGRNFTQLLP